MQVNTGLYMHTSRIEDKAFRDGCWSVEIVNRYKWQKLYNIIDRTS